MTRTYALLLSFAATLSAPSALRAQFAEDFDSQATAFVTIQSQPDTTVTFVDYSNMTVGSTSFSLPEAPRPIGGSAPTRGVLVRANITGGAAAAVNILAGNTPVSFSGRYRLSFDAWQNVPTSPVPGGSTEQLLWGVGLDTTAPIEARNTRLSGTMGVWGWLCGDNGYGTEDAAIFQDGTELADLGDTQTGEGVPFNEAFDQPLVPGAPNHAAANQWVRVDVEVDPSGVRVFFNGVEFFNQPGLSPRGFAMIGYEDPFGSVGTDPDGQWCVFDNFRVCSPLSCGGPGTASTQGTATAGQILNGSASPSVGCPVTIRLRGGPANAAVMLAIGEPAASTIPLIVGSCALGVEVGPIILTTLLEMTNGVGSAQHSIEVPNSVGVFGYCGQRYGFQYFWLDSSACRVAHTEGLVLTIGS